MVVRHVAAVRDRVSVTMFGRFAARHGDADPSRLGGRKVEELAAFLLLFRAKPHRREALAEELWSGQSPELSKKHLRQAVWRIQSALRGLLLVDAEWIQVDDSAGVWLDVAELESAFDAARGHAGEHLPPTMAGTVEGAIGVYRGDLLEGWDQDWCLFERERLKAMHLTLVEKMLAYHEAHRRPEDALHYGERILRLDRAHERAHRRLMRLRYLAGDRTGALRQYEACVAALREELDVGPSEPTRALYQQIRTGESLDPST